MKNLSRGARAAEVFFLQRLLNKHGAYPELAEDGDFGAKTGAAVIKFKQKKKLLPYNDSVDDRTWSALGATFSREWQVTLMGQADRSSCWTAAASMIEGGGITIGPGDAELRPDNNALRISIENIMKFVTSMGWRQVNHSIQPPVSVFISGIIQGPIWLSLDAGNFAHAVVVSGVWSDMDEDGSGTVMRLHDPWPVGSGTVYGSSYAQRFLRLRSLPGIPWALATVAAVD